MLQPSHTERVAHALGLEKLSLAKEAEEINEESRRLEEQTASEFAARGLRQSGMFADRIASIHQNRAKRMVDTQIELRRVTLRSAPELASDEKFKALLDSTSATIDRVLASIPERLRSFGFHVLMDAVHPRDDLRARSLKAHARREIGILEQRYALETIKDMEGSAKPEIMATRSPKSFFPTANSIAETQSINKIITKNSPNPKAFLSYSWDSTEHRAWVRELASRLREDGVETILDLWHLKPGHDRFFFMESAISEADFVLIICSTEYAQKANRRDGGVGYEAAIITPNLAGKVKQTKFIPVLRDGDWDQALPLWLSSRNGFDLRGGRYDEAQYGGLLDHLHGRAATPPPIATRQQRIGDETTYGEGLKRGSAISAISPEVTPKSILARVFLETGPWGKSGDVNTVKVSVVLENLSQAKRIREYTVTLSVPRACLTFSSSIFVDEIKSDEATRRFFRRSESSPGVAGMIFPGDKISVFALDLGVDQLKLKGTYLEGDIDAALADKLTVEAIVGEEPLYAEKFIADIFNV